MTQLPFGMPFFHPVTPAVLLWAVLVVCTVSQPPTTSTCPVLAAASWGTIYLPIRAMHSPLKNEALPASDIVTLPVSYPLNTGLFLVGTGTSLLEEQEWAHLLVTSVNVTITNGVAGNESLTIDEDYISSSVDGPASMTTVWEEGSLTLSISNLLPRNDLGSILVVLRSIRFVANNLDALYVPRYANDIYGFGASRAITFNIQLASSCAGSTTLTALVETQFRNGVMYKMNGGHTANSAWWSAVTCACTQTLQSKTSAYGQDVAVVDVCLDDNMTHGLSLNRYGAEVPLSQNLFIPYPDFMSNTWFRGPSNTATCPQAIDSSHEAISRQYGYDSHSQFFYGVQSGLLAGDRGGDGVIALTDNYRVYYSQEVAVSPSFYTNAPGAARTIRDVIAVVPQSFALRPTSLVSGKRILQLRFVDGAECNTPSLYAQIYLNFTYLPSGSRCPNPSPSPFPAGAPTATPSPTGTITASASPDRVVLDANSSTLPALDVNSSALLSGASLSAALVTLLAALFTATGGSVSV